MENSPHLYTTSLHPTLIEFGKKLRSRNRHLTVLDVGCGDGLKIGALVDRGIFTPEDDLIGLDVNPIRIARTKAAFPYLDTRVGNAETLEGIPDSSCDGVMSSAVLEHLPNPQNFVSSVHRVLKPGGIAYITSLVRKRFVVSYFKNSANEFARDPEHFYEYRSNDEFIHAITPALSLVKFHASTFDITLDCFPLLLRRLHLLNDSLAANWFRSWNGKWPGIKIADPFWHRVEAILIRN
jgi:SAM-dependent methyltransferase